jgi:ABC-type antimicrobial peptide transport system permease subunit
MPDKFRLISRSIIFYKKPVLNQVLIIGMLTAVITGSLLTGGSVKESLKKSASRRLGNTGILISSGMRYFDLELVNRIKDSSSVICTGILEINGSSRDLKSQRGAFNTHIYGVNNDFFVFQGIDRININPGEVAVNRRLADYLEIKPGDDLIIKFPETSDIPIDAPFAPDRSSGRSVVKRVGFILENEDNGGFSLSISQIEPMNVFMNLQELEEDQSGHIKINRILIGRDDKNSLELISETLKNNLETSDIGLHIRYLNKTNQYEIVSDRVFIDESLLEEVKNLLPSSSPVITYLANRIESASATSPYSFVTALPSSLYPEISNGTGVIINKWMAEDLSVTEGETIRMDWYSPDSLNKLVEKGGEFIIKRIADNNGIWSDSLLMPDFPGISGKESCSDWDAGVPIKMSDIRPKDEDYWNKYRGTPKAFISYEKGRELWANNFGPATAIRFSSSTTQKDITDKLNGSLNPDKMGFSLTDLYGESVKAADESVDFGTLFLSLSFFLILSSLVLLSFATSLYFDSKREHIITLHYLGFRNKRITWLLFLETGLISLAGCLAGAFAGYFVDIIITGALNTVWNGAVQTDTLNSYFKAQPVIIGFLLTFMTTVVFLLIKIKSYLKKLNRKEKEVTGSSKARLNLLLLILASIITTVLLVLSIVLDDRQILLSFAAGTMLLITFILSWRQYFSAGVLTSGDSLKRINQLSKLYYSINPSSAVTPILFIAAGIFTVFITGANRITSDEKQLERSGGTGGYLLWCENTLPVIEDMRSVSGRKAMGFDSEELADIGIVPIKRSAGNDASCLNLNHITAPPLLGLDPADFISKMSFSFAKALKSDSIQNPWQFLKLAPVDNTIYGIADQTVLDWSLKMKPGDTIILRAESGQPLKIIIAAGLQTSVFQGNLLIGSANFSKYYPSVSGTALFLADGNGSKTELYKSSIEERLENYGVFTEKTTDRLESFNRVTNTYLSVFGFFGALGLITGVGGLGFIFLRNYGRRKNEFALMMATGFNIKKIRSMILSEQMMILFAGIVSGTISALVATLPSFRNYHELPWLFLGIMILCIIITGITTMALAVRSVTKNSLIISLKKE